jgi:uncharacterized membrane protein
MSAIDTAQGATLTAIFAMAAVTYFLRTSGYWIMGRVPITGRVRRMLDALPGSIVVAIVLPIVVKSGVPAIVAICVVIAVMVLRRSDLLAVLAGVGTVALVRAAGF